MHLHKLVMKTDSFHIQGSFKLLRKLEEVHKVVCCYNVK